MSELTLLILFGALALDWFLGEPDFIWGRLPHPVVLFGRVIAWIDKTYNIETDSEALKYKKGALAFCGVLALAIVAGLLFNVVCSYFGIAGYILELFLVFALLAQRSLFDHVYSVATQLRDNGIDAGREAVGKIVGRDPELLDGSGVSRAAIESLAENFSDGVVAPAFWYAVFGLPGLLAYKMINTADSMLGYRNEKYLWFGRAAAKIDDLANWLPARLSVVFIGAGSGLLFGWMNLKSAIAVAFRDSGLHRSPNAGWPEAAMAGGIDIALGGPRKYRDEIVQQSYLNASGKQLLSSEDVFSSLEVFKTACFVLWSVVALLWLLA